MGKNESTLLERTCWCQLVISICCFNGPRLLQSCLFQRSNLTVWWARLMLGWVLWLQFLFSWCSHRMSVLRSSARSCWAVMPGMSLKSDGGSRDLWQVKQQCMVSVSVTIVSVLWLSYDGKSFLYWRFAMTWRGANNTAYYSLWPCDILCDF